MKEILIKAEARERVGKGSARQTRMIGNIPAVVYGPEFDSKPITLNERELNAAMKSAAGSSVLYTLDIDGKSNKVILRDLQRDPITSKIVHADFHAVSMTKSINLSIPIHFEGIPIGVKVDGGIMQTNMRELEISCLPSQIPEFIKLDVENLSIGDSIHVKDLDLEGINVLSDENRTVVVISAPTVVKEPVVEGAEEEVEGDEAAEGAEGAEGAEATDAAAEGKGKSDEKSK